ncbi:MAG: L-seryl-tRNA(Sec) selenium transferase [Candidatus Krumholzibacteriota bacterium]|nr:L-seryl-tRNA(Sec) selenium transferase [Candidatus Krumholzibacteriota bacterium]
MTELERALQAIPAVDRILASPPFAALGRRWRREGLRRYVQLRLDGYREDLRAGRGEALDRRAFLARLPRAWAADWRDLAGRGTRRVLNATGVALHTNLGRAPLAPAARRAVERAGRGAVDLELDLASGKRASRVRKVEVLLRALTGAEAAFAVNNNAAALTLAVDTLARKRRLIVSRGEQVEIGGSFRLPEILSRFAGTMVEVGTTNRTRLADYAKAIARRGDVLLKVHRSNFRLEGYVSEVDLADLAALGRERGCPVIHDLGSGRFDPEPGWLSEPQLAAVLAAGPDLVTFSGDKVFGGPQAGIILGRADLVAALRANPLARALRLDKLSLAALIETLALRLRADAALPVQDLMTRSRAALRAQAEDLAARLADGGPPALDAVVVDSEARSGGGAAAEADWPSAALRLRLAGCPAGRLAARLREADPAVLGVVRREELLLDMAALPPEEIPILARVLLRALNKEAASA